LDVSGYVCNNTWGIKGAWYCYSDGADSTISCKGSDGKGAGAIPWNAGQSAMCLSGTMGTGASSYAGIGFKVNSGPPGDTAAPGTWNASQLVGFAITLGPGAGGKGSGGMILNLEYPTSTDLDPNTKDAPGITVPGVPASGMITYNALFADAVLANNANNRKPVDPQNLTDVKIAFFPDSITHSYDFCIKSIVPIMIPTAKFLHIDMVHFGVVVVVNIMIGLLTPPFGLLLFVVANMTRQPLMAIVREAFPFIMMSIVVLALITLVPETVLWLPRVMGYKG